MTRSALWISVSIGLGWLGTATVRAEMAAAAADAPSTASALAPSTPVAYAKSFGYLTLGEIMEYASINQVAGLEGVLPSDIPTLGRDRLEQAARWIVSRKLAEAEYDRMLDGVPLKEYCTQVFENARRQSYLSLLARTEIENRMTSPTEAQLREYYQKHLPEFYQPFQFTMRHLILLTYQTYVVQDGDTLESIAQRISGDPARAADIRALLPSRPLRREPNKEFKPLVPGERLLVPMSDADAELVRARLENILKQLDEGTSFEKLAAQYSEADSKGEVSEPLPTGTREMLPQLLEAARQTPVGGVSPIFRTKHGWQVIQVVSKTPEGTKPFEAVRTEIVQRLRNEQREKLQAELLSALVDQPALRVDYDRIADGNRLTSDTVVASIGEYQMRWGDFRPIWATNGQPSEPERIRALLTREPGLVNALVEHYLQPKLADPQSQISRLLRHLRTQLIGTALLTRQAQMKANQTITPDMERTFYEERKDEFFRLSTMVRYEAMEAHLTTEQYEAGPEVRREALAKLVDDMQRTLQTVDSPSRFADRAAMFKEAIRAAGARPLYGSPDEPTPLEALPVPMIERLEKLEPGHWSEPFVIDDRSVVAVLLIERKGASYRPFEEVQDFIHEYIMQQRVRTAYDTLVNELLANDQFRMALP